MFAVAYSIVTHKSFSVPARFGMLGVHGHYYSKWYPLLSVLAAPFVAIGAALGAHLRLPPLYAAQATALLLPVIFFAINVYLTTLLSLRLGASRRGALWAGVAFAFGTIALVYAREFFADPLLATLTSIGLYSAFQLSTSQSRLTVFGASALAVLAKPTGVVVGPCLTIYGVLKNGFLKKRSTLSEIAPSLGTFCGLTVYLFYNWFRFGHIFRFGQPFAFGLLNLPVGLFGLLVSPGHGLIWYCPVLVTLAGVPFCVYRKIEGLTILLVAGAYLGFYSAWGDWAGGWCWGPRFLLPILPGLIAFIGLLDSRWRKALGVLTLIGFLLNSPNLIGYYARYYQEANKSGISETAQLWSFSEGPLVGVWRSDYHQIKEALKPSNDIKDVIREAGEAPANDPFQSPCLRVVPLWWWILPAVGLPRVFGATLALLLICLGSIAIFRAFNEA